MKIKALEYFITLAESQSINEAAEKLYIAQPSLTKALQLLEKEINVQLFYRTKAGISLTEEGRKILPEAKQILEYYNGWLQLSKQSRLDSVDIYAHASLSGFLIPDIILQFRELYPDLQINYVTTPVPEAYISTNTQKPVISLALCDGEQSIRNLAKRQGDSPVILFQGEFVCLINKENRLAGKSAVTLEDLEELYFVMPKLESFTHSDSAISPILQGIIDTVSLKKVIQVELVSNVIELLERKTETFAISYFPVLNRYNGVSTHELIYIPFQDAPTTFQLCLFYSRQCFRQYPPMQTLVKTIRQSFTQYASAFDLPAIRVSS